MNYNPSVFYGIDFKKIHLYCKFNLENAFKVRTYFREHYDYFLDIKPSKYYEVIVIGMYDEYVKIKVLNKKTQNLVTIKVDFDFVEFAYYFENTKEEELNSLEL